jgi:hypothetical protein
MRPREEKVSGLIGELERRWLTMFSGLAAGDDLPPAVRLRAEGLMEAAVIAGEATEKAVTEAMDACYRRAFGRALAQDFGPDWREFHPFPEIPAMALRAPVYPSTPD